VRTTVATSPGASAERFLDDGLDGPGTPPAFRAASKTSVNLLRRAPQGVGCGHGGANVVIGQHVTGTHNHENGTQLPYANGSILLDRLVKRKGKTHYFKLFQIAREPAVGGGYEIALTL
jgi:hypothetical protein